MKSLYVLPILMAFPVSAFAGYGSYNFKPFIGYNVSVARYNHTYIEHDNHYLAKINDWNLNMENPGQFVFGVEIADVVALSLMPSVNTVSTKSSYGYKEDAKYNELDFGVDVFLTKNKSFKQYISLELGYIDMDNSTKAKGAIFGAGIGCKKYFDNKMYIGANLGYAYSTKMKLKKMDDYLYDDTTIQISGANLSFEVGYRF